MLFKKRKSRKELLKEIEQLKKEASLQKNYKIDLGFQLDAIQQNIKTIGTVCISLKHRECDDVIKEEICYLLAKELKPYVTYESYAYAPTDEFMCGEVKHIGTIKVVTDEIRV